MPSTVRGGFVRGAGAQVHRIFLILMSSLNRSVVPNTGEYAALPGGPALRLFNMPYGMLKRFVSDITKL